MKNLDNKLISDKWLIVLIIPLFGFLIIFTSCSSQFDEGAIFKVEVTNDSDLNRESVLVELEMDRLLEQAEIDDPENLAVYLGKKEIPTQINSEKLYFLVEKLNAGEKVNFSIKNVPRGNDGVVYIKRTQAELSIKEGGHFENRKYIGGDFKNINYLRVPDEHTDHSYYIRYEGPGWESDLVGYRFYLDWRNATDVFGKKTREMVLQKVGLDGFDSYHEMQPWGVDVLKVGKSLGLGSPAAYVKKQAQRIDVTDSITCEISDNGNIYSSITTNYYGWKVDGNSHDVISKLSIHAGTRLTYHTLHISGDLHNFCTGVVKDPKARLYADPGNGDHWGYLATFGDQSLNNDHLGLAVFFSNEYFKGFTEDEHSHIVKIKQNAAGEIEYYFMAIWEGEADGYTNENEFLEYIHKTANALAHPPAVGLKAI